MSVEELRGFSGEALSVDCEDVVIVFHGVVRLDVAVHADRAEVDERIAAGGPRWMNGSPQAPPPE